MILTRIFSQVFGSRNQRILKRMWNVVSEINALEPQMIALSDTELQNKTQEFRDRLKQGEVLEKILPEAFAVVREAGKRVLKMRHFDVQLLGGMVLNNGCIAEM